MSSCCVITQKVSPALHQPSCSLYLWIMHWVYFYVLVTDWKHCKLVVISSSVLQLESLLFFILKGKLMMDTHSHCWLQPLCALRGNELWNISWYSWCKAWDTYLVFCTKLNRADAVKAAPSALSRGAWIYIHMEIHSLKWRQCNWKGLAQYCSSSFNSCFFVYV